MQIHIQGTVIYFHQWNAATLVDNICKTKDNPINRIIFEDGVIRECKWFVKWIFWSNVVDLIQQSILHGYEAITMASSMVNAILTDAMFYKNQNLHEFVLCPLLIRHPLVANAMDINFDPVNCYVSNAEWKEAGQILTIRKTHDVLTFRPNPQSLSITWFEYVIQILNNNNL